MSEEGRLVIWLAVTAVSIWAGILFAIYSTHAVEGEVKDRYQYGLFSVGCFVLVLVGLWQLF